MQPQFHAGSGLTRRISPLSCCTTMQGPSHETQSRSPQGIACYRSRAICRPNAWCGMVQPTLTAHPRSCCHSDNTTQTPPATQGYAGLHKIALVPVATHRMHQFAQFYDVSVASKSTPPSCKRRNYRTNCTRLLHAQPTARFTCTHPKRRR